MKIMTETRWVVKAGLVVHLIGDFMWMPLFHWLRFPMWASWLVGYAPFQVVAYAIILPIVYRRRKEIKRWLT